MYGKDPEAIAFRFPKLPVLLACPLCLFMGSNILVLALAGKQKACPGQHAQAVHVCVGSA